MPYFIKSSNNVVYKPKFQSIQYILSPLCLNFILKKKDINYMN